MMTGGGAAHSRRAEAPTTRVAVAATTEGALPSRRPPPPRATPLSCARGGGGGRESGQRGSGIPAVQTGRTHSATGFAKARAFSVTVECVRSKQRRAQSHSRQRDGGRPFDRRFHCENGCLRGVRVTQSVDVSHAFLQTF